MASQSDDTVSSQLTALGLQQLLPRFQQEELDDSILDGAQIAGLAQVGLAAQQASAMNIRVQRDRKSFAQFLKGCEEVMSVIWAPELYSEMLKCVEISVTITVKIQCRHDFGGYNPYHEVRIKLNFGLRLQCHMPSFVIPADPPDPCESPKVELFTPKPVPGLHEAVRLQYSDWSPVYGPESVFTTVISDIRAFNDWPLPCFHQDVHHVLCSGLTSREFVHSLQRLLSGCTLEKLSPEDMLLSAQLFCIRQQPTFSYILYSFLFDGVNHEILRDLSLSEHAVNAFAFEIKEECGLDVYSRIFCAIKHASLNFILSVLQTSFRTLKLHKSFSIHRFLNYCTDLRPYDQIWNVLVPSTIGFCTSGSVRLATLSAGLCHGGIMAECDQFELVYYNSELVLYSPMGQFAQGDDIASVFDTLTKDEKIRPCLIYVSSSNVSDFSFERISEALKTSSSLEDLYLVNSHAVSDVSVKRIAEALKTNTSLKNLFLFGNSETFFDEIDGSYLLEAMKYNTTLSHISIQSSKNGNYRLNNEICALAMRNRSPLHAICYNAVSSQSTWDWATSTFAQEMEKIQDFLFKCRSYTAVNISPFSHLFDSADFRIAVLENLSMNKSIDSLTIPCDASQHLLDWIPSMSGLKFLKVSSFCPNLEKRAAFELVQCIISVVGLTTLVFEKQFPIEDLCHLLSSVEYLRHIYLHEIDDSEIARLLVAALKCPSKDLKVIIPSTLTSIKCLDLSFSMIPHQHLQPILSAALHINTLKSLTQRGDIFCNSKQRLRLNSPSFPFQCKEDVEFSEFIYELDPVDFHGILFWDKSPVKQEKNPEKVHPSKFGQPYSSSWQRKKNQKAEREAHSSLVNDSGWFELRSTHTIGEKLQILSSNFAKIFALFLDVEAVDALDQPLSHDVNLHRVRCFYTFISSNDPFEGFSLEDVDPIPDQIPQYLGCLDKVMRISSFWDFLQNIFQNIKAAQQQYFSRALVNIVAFWCQSVQTSLPESTRCFFTSLIDQKCHDSINALTVLLLLKRIRSFDDYSFVCDLATRIDHCQLVLEKLEGILLASGPDMVFEDLFRIFESALQNDLYFQHSRVVDDDDDDTDASRATQKTQTFFIPLQSIWKILFEKCDADVRLRVIDFIFHLGARRDLNFLALLQLIVSCFRSVKTNAESNQLISHVHNHLSDKSDQFQFFLQSLLKEHFAFRCSLCQNEHEIDVLLSDSRKQAFGLDFWVEVLGQASICPSIVDFVLHKIGEANLGRFTFSQVQAFVANSKLSVEELERIIRNNCFDVLSDYLFWEQLFLKNISDPHSVLKLMVSAEVDHCVVNPHLQAIIISSYKNADQDSRDCLHLLIKSNCDIVEKTWQSGFAQMQFHQLFDFKKTKSETAFEKSKYEVSTAIELFVKWKPYTGLPAWKRSFMSLFMREELHSSIISFARDHLSSGTFFAEFFDNWDLHSLEESKTRKNFKTLAFTKYTPVEELDALRTDARISAESSFFYRASFFCLDWTRIKHTCLLLLPQLSVRLMSLSFIDCGIQDQDLDPLLSSDFFCKCGQLEKLYIEKNPLSSSRIKHAISSLRSLPKLRSLSFKFSHIGTQEALNLVMQIANDGFAALQFLELDSMDANVREAVALIQGFPSNFPSKTWLDLVNYFKLSVDESHVKIVRFMFIGDSTAGKTSLSQALRSKQSQAEHIPLEIRTVGIDMEDLNFHESVRARCWDFAGQEVYFLPHSMHLSDDCLYLLVFKCPETMPEFENTLSRLRVWLELLSSYVVKAKIVLVGTHASNQNEPPAALQERENLTKRVRVEVERLNVLKRTECESLQSMLNLRCTTLTSQLKKILKLREYLRICDRLLSKHSKYFMSKMISFSKILEFHLDSGDDLQLHPFFHYLLSHFQAPVERSELSYRLIFRIVKNLHQQLDCFSRFKNEDSWNKAEAENDVFETLTNFNSRTGIPACIFDLTTAAQDSIENIKEIRQKLHIILSDKSSSSSPSPSPSGLFNGLHILDSFFVDSRLGLQIPELRSALLEISQTETVFPSQRIVPQAKEILKRLSGSGFLSKDQVFEKCSSDVASIGLRDGWDVNASTRKSHQIMIWSLISYLAQIGDVFLYKDMFCSNIQLVVNCLKPLMLPSVDILALCDRVDGCRSQSRCVDCASSVEQCPSCQDADSLKRVPYLDLLCDSVIGNADSFKLLRRLANSSLCSSHLLDFFVGWPQHEVRSNVLGFFRNCGLLEYVVDSKYSDRKEFFISARVIRNRAKLPDFSHKQMDYHARFDMTIVSLGLFAKILSVVMSRDMNSINVNVDYSGNWIIFQRNECDCIIELVPTNPEDDMCVRSYLCIQSNEPGFFRFAVYCCETVLSSGRFGLISKYSIKSFDDPHIQFCEESYERCPLSSALRDKISAPSNTEDKLLKGFQLRRCCPVCVMFCGQNDGITAFVELVCDKFESMALSNVWLCNADIEIEVLEARMQQAKIVIVFLTPEFILSSSCIQMLEVVCNYLHSIRIVLIPLHPAVSFHTLEQNLERVAPVGSKFHLCVPHQGSSYLQPKLEDLKVYTLSQSTVDILKKLLMHQSQGERRRVDIWLQLQAWKRDDDSSNWYEIEQQIHPAFRISHSDFSSVCLVHSDKLSAPQPASLSLLYDIVLAYKDDFCLSTIYSEPLLASPWFRMSERVPQAGGKLETVTRKYNHENIFLRDYLKEKPNNRGEFLKKHFHLSLSTQTQVKSLKSFVDSIAGPPSQYNCSSSIDFSSIDFSTPNAQNLFPRASHFFEDKQALGHLASLGLSDEDIVDVIEHFTTGYDGDFPVSSFMASLCSPDLCFAPFFRYYQSHSNASEMQPAQQELQVLLSQNCPKVVVLVEGLDDLHFFRALFDLAKCSAAKMCQHAACRDASPIFSSSGDHMSYEYSVDASNSILRIVQSSQTKIKFGIPRVVEIMMNSKVFPFEIKDNDLNFVNTPLQKTSRTFQKSPKARIDHLQWGRAIENYLLPIDASLRIFFDSSSPKALEFSIESLGCLAKHFFPVPPDSKFNSFFSSAWKFADQTTDPLDFSNKPAEEKRESYYRIEMQSLSTTAEHVLSIFLKRGYKCNFCFMIEALEETFLWTINKDPGSIFKNPGDGSPSDIEKQYSSQIQLMLQKPSNEFIKRMHSRVPSRQPFWQLFPSFCCFLSFVCDKIKDLDSQFRKDASSVLVLLQNVLLDLICQCPNDTDPESRFSFDNLFMIPHGQSLKCKELCLLARESLNLEKCVQCICATCGQSADKHVFRYSCCDLSAPLGPLTPDHVKFANSLCRFGSICWEPHKKIMTEIHGAPRLYDKLPADSLDMDQAFFIYREHLHAHVFDESFRSTCSKCLHYARSHTIPSQIIECTRDSVEVLRLAREAELTKIFNAINAKVTPNHPIIASAVSPTTGGGAAAAGVLQRGRIPDIAWGAVSMDELRAHPSFDELSPASSVAPSVPAELRLFRQDSPQWHAVREGRITTGTFAACLGVYEEKAAEVIGVPSSLRGHDDKALDAHARLALPLLIDLSKLNPQLWQSGQDRAPLPASASSAIWPSHTDDVERDSSPFLRAFRPMPRTAGRSIGCAQSISQIRKNWGRAQEATAILSAVNYFVRRGAVVEEAGLQPFEALPVSQRVRFPSGLPPMGASPDAIVKWPDGAVEPLEVKCHAPFADTSTHAMEAGMMPFELRDLGPFVSFPVWHIPQMYMHMLCLGEACSKALFMSASATRGVNIFRVRRDEALLQDMLQFVARFNADYGSGRPPPLPNFFWDLPGYARFLENLKDAGRTHVELIAHIPDDKVQRAGKNQSFFLD